MILTFRSESWNRQQRGDKLISPFQINGIVELIGEEPNCGRKWSQSGQPPAGHHCSGPSSAPLALRTRCRCLVPMQSHWGILGVRYLPCLLPQQLVLVLRAAQINGPLKLVLLSASVPLHSDDEGGCGTHPLLSMIWAWWGALGEPWRQWLVATKSHMQHHVKMTRQWGSSLTWQESVSFLLTVLWQRRQYGRMLARTCKYAFLFHITCDSLHGQLLALFWRC